MHSVTTIQITLVTRAVEDDSQIRCHSARLPSQQTLVGVRPAVRPAHRDDVFAAELGTLALRVSLVVQTAYFRVLARDAIARV